MTFEAVPMEMAAFLPSDSLLASMEMGKPPTDRIPYGNNAPELSTRPVEWQPGLHPARALGQLKVDGINATYIQGKFYSLQGVPLHCADHCLNDAAALERRMGHDMVFATEFENGLFNDTISAMQSQRGGKGRVWVHDALPFAQWAKDDCKEALWRRVRGLEEVFGDADLEHTGLLRSFEIAKEQVQPLVELVAAQNLEGIVVKDMDSFFQRRVSATWLKAKATVTEDGVVIDCTAKGLVVKFKCGQHKVSMGVPKGLDTADTIGRTAECAFNLESGTLRPRHIRFVRWREDKDTRI